MIETPLLEIAEIVREVGGAGLLDCKQCGACTSLCPWGLVDAFGPRLLIRQVQLGLDGYEEQAVWQCATCGLCDTRCPRQLGIIDTIRATRAVLVDSGVHPPSWGAPLASVRGDGNPWGAPREQRGAWAADFPALDADSEGLLFACCTHALDPRGRRALADIAGLLQGAGCGLGVIGNAESCCGEQILECGDLEAFEGLRGANAALFGEHGVRSIVTTSPHCLDTFSRHHEGLEVRHQVQVLDEAIAAGALVPERPVEARVAFHDPCYLGRHQGIYDPPRRVLDAIPGVERVELPRSREASLCCGGGGGGAWREVPVEQRFSVLRIREALDLGVEVLATACPYCTLMLEDALLALEIEPERLRVLDVAELLRASVSEGAP